MKENTRKIFEYIKDKLFPNKGTFFSRTRKENILITKKTFRKFYPIYNDSLKTMLEVIDLLIEEKEEKKDDKFNKACLILMSRSIQHLESIVILTESGLYGDAWVLLMGVLSDMSMMQYLHYREDLIDLFLNEKGDDYQLNKKFKKSFNEGAIEYYLVSIGMPPFKESFQKISKTAHASSWGTQFYGTEGEGNKYHLKYRPGLEVKKALIMLTLIVSAHWDFLNIILWHRNHSNLDIQSDPWEDIKKKVKKLYESILKFNAIGTKVLFNFEDIVREHGKKDN